MRDITNNDFTVMESNSEDFYAFRIDTVSYTHLTLPTNREV